MSSHKQVYIFCSNVATAPYTHTYVQTSMYISFPYIALVITNGPMNVTICSGTKANISCGYTGVDPFTTRPNWRIIKRNNNGSVISNETVSGSDIRHEKFNDLRFVVRTSGNAKNANGSYLSVGPVDDTYNNTSYQCIFTINDTIIESGTAATITAIGIYICMWL